MKKLIPILSILVFLSFFVELKEDVVKIPSTAIRFRVIANSNNKEDQELKQKVKRKIQQELYLSVKDANSIEEARNITKKKLKDYKSLIEGVLDEENTNTEVKINYGNNYFPEKLYNGVFYPEGNYESLVVTLGDGLGDNWWCILFPPLCSLEAETKEQSEEIEYKFFIKELIDKYF